MLLDYFAIPFLQRAATLSLTLGLASAALSVFLVQRRGALIGDALSHAVLPGIVLAHVLQLPLFLGALLSAWLCAVAIHVMQRRSHLKQDTITGALFTSFFALGLLLITQIHTDTHLLHILFGDMLGISFEQTALSAALHGAVLVLLLVMHRPLLAALFANHQGAVMLLFTGLVTVHITTAVYTTGLLLIVAQLILPGATARLLFYRWQQQMIFALPVAAAANLLGLVASVYYNLPPAPAMVVCQSTVFVGAYLWRWLRHRRWPLIHPAH